VTIAGVIDQDIDRADFALDRCDRRRYGGGVGDIENLADCTPRISGD